MRLVTATLFGVGALLAGPSFAAVATAAGSSPAQRIELSRDGTSFARELSGPLFPGGFRIVPGGHIDRDLWVRNTASTPGRLRIDLLRAQATDPVLAKALTISVQTVNGNGDPTATTVATAGACSVLLSEVPVASGKAVHIQVRAVLGNLRGRQAQGERVSFDLRAVLVDAAVPRSADPASCAIPDGGETTKVPGTPGGGGDDGPRVLAWTGTTGVPEAGAVAFLALLVGGVLVAVARRRRRKDDPRDGNEGPGAPG